MEMNNHESRRVREMATLFNDLLETRRLSVHQFNASTGEWEKLRDQCTLVLRTVISAAEVPLPFLAAAVRLLQVTGTC